MRMQLMMRGPKGGGCPAPLMTAKSDKCTQKPHRKVFSKCTENHHHLRAFLPSLGTFLLAPVPAFETWPVPAVCLLPWPVVCFVLLSKLEADSALARQTGREGQREGEGGRLTERLMCNNYPKLICLFAPARQSVKVELANRPTHLPFIQSCTTFSSSPLTLLQMSVIMGGAHGASFGKFRAEFPCGSLCEQFLAVSMLLNGQISALFSFKATA